MSTLQQSINDWSTKNFYYRIINQKGIIVGIVNLKLSELENFAKKSKFEIQQLQRTGPDNFNVYVQTDKTWKIS